MHGRYSYSHYVARICRKQFYIANFYGHTRPCEKFLWRLILVLLIILISCDFTISYSDAYFIVF
uniref:Uncharacterized protein n=1 Tax=Triticum urartu TaxID=4572 RepID=A0A8R7U004_TRIUA